MLPRPETHPVARAELEALIARSERSLVEVVDSLPEKCLFPGRCTNGLLNAVGERIGERCYEMQSIILSRNERCVLTEPTLDYITAPLAKESIEEAIATAHNRLAVDLICKSQSRHEVVLGSVVEAAIIFGGKQQSARDLEISHLGSRSRGIALRSRECRRSLRTNRLDVDVIKSADAAIVSLGQRSLVFVSKPQVQRQVRSNLPVVLKVETRGGRLLGIIRQSCHIAIGRCWQAQKERCERLSQTPGSGRGIVQRSACPGRIEIEAPGHIVNC